MSQCTYRCVVLPDKIIDEYRIFLKGSQCTYRCVVLPDVPFSLERGFLRVSMHLQVRGAP